MAFSNQSLQVVLVLSVRLLQLPVLEFQVLLVSFLRLLVSLVRVDQALVPFSAQLLVLLVQVLQVQGEFFFLFFPSIYPNISQWSRLKRFSSSSTLWSSIITLSPIRYRWFLGLCRSRWRRRRRRSCTRLDVLIL